MFIMPFRHLLAAITITALTASLAHAVDVPAPDGPVDMQAATKSGFLPDMALGLENAPVTIIEYTSLSCARCADFHNTTFEGLKKAYIDTGRVRLIIREMPHNPEATAAAMLARCNPQNPQQLSTPEQYYAMVDKAFEQKGLNQIAKAAGFSEENYTTCLANQKLLEEVNASAQRASNEFGVSETPTLLINGKRYGGVQDMSLETLSALIENSF